MAAERRNVYRNLDDNETGAPLERDILWPINGLSNLEMRGFYKHFIPAGCLPVNLTQHNIQGPDDRDNVRDQVADAHLP